MQNIILILNAITIPLGSLTTILIISKNKRNISNLLIGLTAFLGCVLSVTFNILKELLFYYNVNAATIFSKLSMLSIFLMSVPILSFSIFFWRVKYKTIPRFLHILTFLPALSLAVWLFADKEVVVLHENQYFSNTFSINSSVKLSYLVFSSIVMLLIIILLIIELSIMAKRTKDYPALRRRMFYFTFGLALGLGGAFLSILISDIFFDTNIEPAPFFVLFTTIILTLTFMKTLSKSKKTLWHGCPKLIIENNTSAFCLNSIDGLPIQVKLLDLGEIFERIQVDVSLLKTCEGNCTNIVFANEQNIVLCLTTHLPIKVLDEEVTRGEMELAREMEISNGNELCSSCLHKIIAYCKQHKDQSFSEIKQIFLGIRAEEFFGVS